MLNLLCEFLRFAPGVVPGVASFALKPRDVGLSLKPLIQYAMKLLDSETW